MLKVPSLAEHAISDTVKPQLVGYIQKQVPSISSSNADFEVIQSYYSWVDAYATTETSSDKASFISNAIVPSASPIQQAAITVSADVDLLSHLQQNTTLQHNISEELGSPNLGDDAKHLLQDALQRLQEPVSVK
jgi:hypothetical protein